jgi:PhzF family phenazine biosynthesis protein
MTISTYHIDAFTDKLFSGNPAAVCILNQWLPDAVLQKIAEENNLPATAFLVREANQFSIRWFGPEYEIDLCGHGTLAAGYVIFNLLEPSLPEAVLHHPIVGALKIQRQDNLISLNFPVKKFTPCEVPDSLIKGLGIPPKKVYEFKKERLLVIFETEEDIKELNPDLFILKQLEYRGIIVTAKGNDIDFVSRVFYPQKTIFEDSVTGSSYCLLVPYWASQLHKTTFHAQQLSRRGGQVRCELNDNLVILHGNAILYQQGEIIYPSN